MSASPIVSFRLAARHHRRLVTQAGAERPDLFARELLVRALEEDVLASRVEGLLSDSATQTKELRRDLSVLFQALLVLFGKATPEEARAWTEKHLG
jgi:hypothetical protein